MVVGVRNAMDEMDGTGWVVVRVRVSGGGAALYCVSMCMSVCIYVYRWRCAYIGIHDTRSTGCRVRNLTNSLYRHIAFSRVTRRTGVVELQEPVFGRSLGPRSVSPLGGLEAAKWAPSSGGGSVQTNGGPASAPNHGVRCGVDASRGAKGGRADCGAGGVRWVAGGSVANRGLRARWVGARGMAVGRWATCARAAYAG